MAETTKTAAAKTAAPQTDADGPKGEAVKGVDAPKERAKANKAASTPRAAKKAAASKAKRTSKASGGTKPPKGADADEQPVDAPVVQGNGFAFTPAPEGFEHSAYSPDNVQHLR